MVVVGHGLSTTTPGRRSFRGNAFVAHTMGDSPPTQFDQTFSGGGDEKYFLPRRFEGVVAATPWGNRHDLYHCQRLEDACTVMVTAEAEAEAAVEAAVTGQKQ
jgi:hypothetical protein